MTSRLRITGFVEDPGAANMAIGLDAALARHGMALRLYAAKWACEHLDKHGIRFTAWNRTDLPEIEGSAAVLVGSCDDARSLSFQLLAHARSLAVPTLGLVDTAANASFRYDGGQGSPLAYLPSRLLVGDSLTAAAFEGLGCPAGRIVTIGLPHLDQLRQRHAGAQPPRRADFCTVPTETPLIIFLAEGRDRYRPEVNFHRPGYTMTGRGACRERNRIVLEEVLDAAAALPGRPAVVVRPHPKTPPDEFCGLEEELASVYTGADLPGLLLCADIVVGMTSMALVEAAVLGRQTLAVLPHPDEAVWLPPLQAGAIAMAASRHEIRALLRDPALLRPRPVLDAIYPPGAAERIAAAVGSLL